MMDNKLIPIPSLGMSFSQLINTRYYITRNQFLKKTIHLKLSPSMSLSSINFEICSEGIKDYNDDN